jgi:hypothetical protein
LSVTIFIAALELCGKRLEKIMRKNSGFFKSATKFLPIFHGQYREMCSLAAVGQLGGPQMSELNEHIATCDSCRKFLESVAQASVQVLPVLAEERISAADIAPPVGMRSRFLSRLTQERLDGLGDRLQVVGKSGGNYREEESFDTSEELVFQRMLPAKVENREKIAGYRGQEIGKRGQGIGVRDERKKKAGARQYIWAPAVVAVAAVIAIAGFYLGRKIPSPKATQTALRAPAPAVIVEDAKAPDNSVTVLERDKNNLETQLTELRTRLTDAKADQDSLRNELVAANEKLASFQRTQAASEENLKEVQDSKTQVALLESETERLRQRLADSETKLAVQRRTTEEVSDKLQITEANLQQELSIKDAKSQMGELVAARNLHIVDVYDADPEGKRQRAFGRVFYTEGKSLVFYAYDLEGAGQMKAKVVFHVWGGKAGVKEVTHSLGILRKDDADQARWAMTFDDPNVLSQINSVFVTAESANKHYDEPHGKKVLFAYFGSAPNHP